MYRLRRRARAPRRRFTRRRYSRRPALNRAIAMCPFPSHAFKVFRWDSPGIYTTSTGAGTGYINGRLFRLNSPYDPDYSSGVNQVSALWWHKYGPAYNYYRVWKTKMTAYFSVADTSTVNDMFAHICCFFEGDTSGATTNGLLNQPFSKHCRVQQSDHAHKGPNKLSYTIRPRQLLGPNQDGSNLVGLWFNNPGFTPFLAILFDNSAYGTELTVRFRVKMKFYTHCWRSLQGITQTAQVATDPDPPDTGPAEDLLDV